MAVAGNTISDEDIPRYVRRCWDRYQTATQEERLAEKESLGFWIGGKHQWRPGECENRQGNNRPWMSINRCKPAVDQVENEARSNPPGPQAHPVGGGADKDGADILEGLIREYEYRSDAKTAYIIALRYGAAGGRGAFELATEYAGERTMEQQLVVKPVTDPALLFYDPDAVMPCREDSMWGGKIRKLSREQLIEDYGAELKVLNRSLFDRGAGAVGGWMADAFGYQNDLATQNVWTGGSENKGPFYVCEFYRVVIERVKLALCTDSIFRLGKELDNMPEGVTIKVDDLGHEIQRWEPKRTVKKYVVTAMDLLKKTDWLGTQIPHFYVMGPEIRMDGKLYRLSLISNAQDAQRGLNYTATSAAEITGSMTKSPWIGWEGQFDTTNAQGFNPWESSNTQMWAYMEVKPTFAQDPITGQSHLMPAPQRNTWEAPIARLMELATFFGEQIKAATSVFFEPSLRSAAQVQSGTAIKELQQQTNIGTLNWQDQLHRAVGLSYQEAGTILRKLLDGPRVKTIVRPDNQHEIVEINREFPASEIDIASGKRKTAGGKLESLNYITRGDYAMHVTAGPNFHERTEKTIEALTEVFHVVPQILQSPIVAAKFLRMVGEGNPQVESLADAIAPDQTQDASPEQMQAMLQKGQQMQQAQQQIIQKLQQALASKLPEIEARKWIAGMNALSNIRAAQIKAGVDTAEIDASMLEHMTGLAHDAGMQATQHAHEKDQQQSQQDAAASSQTQAEGAAAEQQQAQQDNQPETGVQ